MKPIKSSLYFPYFVEIQGRQAPIYFFKVRFPYFVKFLTWLSFKADSLPPFDYLIIFRPRHFSTSSSSTYHIPRILTFSLHWFINHNTNTTFLLILKVITLIPLNILP